MQCYLTLGPLMLDNNFVVNEMKNFRNIVYVNTMLPTIALCYGWLDNLNA